MFYHLETRWPTSYCYNCYEHAIHNGRYLATTHRCSKRRYNSPPVHTNVGKYAMHNVATCINP